MTRRRLVAIVENSEDAILSKSLEGIITSWNAGAERLFVAVGGGVLGPMSACRIIPAERQAEEAETVERLRRGECIPALELCAAEWRGQAINMYTDDLGSAQRRRQ